MRFVEHGTEDAVMWLRHSVLQRSVAVLMLAVGAFVGACGSPAAPLSLQPTEAPHATLQQIADDVRLPHEGRPHGVPDSYGWARQPRLGMGNKPGRFQALTALGQLYEDRNGNPATNTRVQIRAMRTLILSRRDGQWHEVQRSEAVVGAAYREDFAGDVHRAANIRAEPDGSISVRAGDSYNFHFWPSVPRATINPADIAGVLTSVEARLVHDSPNRLDDRAQAHYLLSMGADYWLSLDAKWDNFRTNGDVGIGRLRYVRPQ